jgi:hypothetical protein
MTDPHLLEILPLVDVTRTSVQNYKSLKLYISDINGAVKILSIETCVSI